MVDFGIYVHTQGPSPFREVARCLDQSVRAGLQSVRLSEIDGLYISFYSTSRFATGMRKLKRRVRRNYDLKLITGGAVRYNCLVELEAEVADAELVDASAGEPALFEYVRACTSTTLEWALIGFPQEELALMQAAVAEAAPPHQPRW